MAELALLRQRRDPVSSALALLTAPGFAALYAAVPVANERAYESYVPSLLVFSVILVVFSSAMALTGERASDPMRRLRMTPVRAWEVLTGHAVVQLGSGIVSLLLTLGAAHLAGFKSAASLPALLSLGALASLSSIGLGLVVSALSPNLLRAFLTSSSLMFVQLLFSGLLFPRPVLASVRVGGVSVSALDLLPTTHLHALLQASLAQGDAALASARMAALGLLSLLYLGLGAALFQRLVMERRLA